MLTALRYRREELMSETKYRGIIFGIGSEVAAQVAIQDLTEPQAQKLEEEIRRVDSQLSALGRTGYGDTLRDRLRNSKLGFDEAIEACREFLEYYSR
ncbi:MAG TPA: hypothetical protein VGP72_05170 [Planctomycetota bacterium]|jgi:hypothetical protein